MSHPRLNLKLKEDSIVQGSTSSPTEYLGQTPEGQIIYMRYRFGRINVYRCEGLILGDMLICKKEGAVHPIFERKYGGDLDGDMTWDKFKELIGIEEVEG